MFKKLIALLLISSQAFAGLPPPTILGQSDSTAKTKFQIQTPHNQVTDLGGVKALIETGNGNIIPDPGFEAATSGWTASGGATAVANSTAKGTGAKGYDWDSNAAAQTLTSTSVTIPNGYQGKNGVLSCNIKTVSGTSTHTIGLWDGSALSSTQTITNSTTSFIETKINFVFPSSGTAAIRLTSISANEPEIYIDDCAIKLADNIGTVSQAILVDAVKVTGCAGQWTTTSTSYASLGTQTGCTYTSSKGVATAPATNIPAFKFASLPSGDYRIEYEGTIGSNTGGNFTSFFQFTDGTNTAREESTYLVSSTAGFVNGISQTISYSTPQSNITLEIKSKVASGGESLIRGTTANPGVFKLYYFPSASQQAVSSAQADYDWTAYTPTFTGFGTVSTSNFFHKRIGDTMYVRGKFTSGTTTAVEARVSLPNSLTTASSTLIPGLTMAGSYVRGGQAAVTAHGGSVLMNSSLGYVTFDRSETYGSGSAQTQTSATASTDFSGSGDIISMNFSVPISTFVGNQRAPTLVGSVTSNASNAERIERAVITTGTTTITSQSIGFLSSLTNNATGDSTLNFTTPFASPPTCTLSYDESGSVTTSTQNERLTATTSTLRVFTWYLDTGGNGAANKKVNIICMGYR